MQPCSRAETAGLPTGPLFVKTPKGTLKFIKNADKALIPTLPHPAGSLPDYFVDESLITLIQDDLN